MYTMKEWFQFINWHPTDQEYQMALAFFSDSRKCVREQFEKLSCLAPVQEQQYAIKYLSENLLPWEYIYLIMPDRYSVEASGDQPKYYKRRTGKERWENAAKTIAEIGFPKVSNIIVPLFMWLLDSNWPGSELIYNFILTLPRDILRAKTNEIINNPQNYSATEHKELQELIAEIYCETAPK